MKFFDSHCHLDLLGVTKPLADVFELAYKNRVHSMLIPATTQESWKRIDDLIDHQLANKSAKTQPLKLYKAYGFHPYFLAQHQLSTVVDNLVYQLQQADKACVAVGEVGLDYASQVCSNQQVKQRQRHLFCQQIEIANQFKKPLIIHHRKSIDDICKYLKQHHFHYGGVVHAFSGSVQQAKNLIDLGFYLGIGGTITYSRANKTKQAIQAVGAARLLLETDSPDMPICGKQGQVNEPGFIPQIFYVLHNLLKHQSEYRQADRLAQQLWQNTHQCFSL
ncbi:TatD family DNase [Catenovulum agarivorans DS-2]|uniref:TatD family DNase n=1 Tax=Catenovulum agarivorans DS-2 TaxID=1328313 RepID=W7QGQ3_9ALTE|nr:TatD family hydrolase [Catenovulum agarivorans]EWH12119.1 TatD family DNase [Catenovulum agarivorans DS-2]